MNKYEYTYAVARINANTSKLLTSQQLNSVIAAPSFDEAVRRVSDFGYGVGDGGYAAALEKRAKEVDELVFGVLPDKKMLDCMIVKNDFANLKVCLKALVGGKSTDGLFTRPSVYAPEEIKKYVFDRKNEKLPECLRHADRSAYRILTQTRFAQLADSVIDRAAMEQTMAFSEKADSPVLREWAQTYVALSDIKVLFRAIKTEKTEDFMLRAVAECSAFDKKDIVNAALKGEDAFFDFLSHTPFASLCDSLKRSAAEFEKNSDGYILALFERYKNDTFGIAPIAAFRYAAQIEILDLRIILSAKHNGMPEDEIRARVRGFDV